MKLYKRCNQCTIIRAYIHTSMYRHARMIDRSPPEKKKKARESIPCFSSSFPSFSMSSPSFPLSCWPSGSFLVEVNKSAMVSADTGGGGPLIGPVSIPAVLSSVYLLFIYIFFFRTLSFMKYMCTCTYQGSEKRRSETFW